MSETSISPLRRRMMEDMMVRKLRREDAQRLVRHVSIFTAFLGQPPNRATPEDLRRFQLHQTETGVAPADHQRRGGGAAFLLQRDAPSAGHGRHLTFVRKPRRITIVRAPEEVACLLEAAPGPKYKAALSAAYGAGLRVSETVRMWQRCIHRWNERDSTRRSDRQHQGGGAGPGRRQQRVLLARDKAIASTVAAPAPPIHRLTTTPVSV
jgi:hypothetical protein